MDDVDRYYNETPSSDVQERDIDLLVAEELSCSITFVQWFFELAYGSVPDQHPIEIRDVDVRHSCLHIGDGYGESDIVLRVEDHFGRHHIFLIEDKINAAFTHEQAERYRKRLKSIIRTDNLADGRTVLMAPQAFLEKRTAISDFDAYVSYETLIEYFTKRANSVEIEELAKRYKYRREFLLKAIRKKTYSGPVVNPDPRVCDFREQYAELIREMSPELRLGNLTKVKEPNEWIRFPDALSDSSRPHRFLLIHKPFSRVSLQVNHNHEGMDGTIESLKILLSGETDLIVDSAKKSFSISILTPKLDMRKPLDDQIDNVKKSVAALLRLRLWFEKNADNIKRVMGVE